MALLLALLISAAAYLQTDLLQAQSITKDVCLSCHSLQGLEKERKGRKVSLVVDPERFSQSAHAPFECVVCHADIAQVPHAAELKRVDCAACHADAVNRYSAGIHGRAREKGFEEAASCTDCHGNIHELVTRRDPASPISRENIAKTCAACHASAALAEKFRIPVVRPVEAYLQSTHARAVAAGKPGAVCSDCHGAHSILPAKDPSASISRNNIPETCGQCHQKIARVFNESIHGEAAVRGVRNAPVCIDCHGEHRILARTERTSPVFAANIPGETCGRCHGDTRMSERFGLAPDKVPAFQDSFHGLALRTGQLTAANCASCHGVHDIRPSSDSRSHVHQANLSQTCGKCHPGAGTRFSLGPVHILPASSPALFWIRLIYLWLIGLTVGFMFLHNALDLTAKARRPQEHRFAIGERPERMGRALRWQHGLVMLSFPLLVYTGFALTYPESWWSAPLLHWETQLGLRGFVHRVAAGVLVAALLWHLIQLWVSRDLRRKLGPLKPTMQDFRDVAATLRYNLALSSEKPRSGKFNYVEKIEYWAFMWGMVIMTATGFLLWFENVTLRYLPKLAADIATAIHFYEAILASLSILIWHFYWVIFDPEVYPMDASWWHGRPPAARVAERGLQGSQLNDRVAGGTGHSGAQSPDSKTSDRS
jgi:thiosulfate reductase cytochrome b subunit